MMMMMMIEHPSMMMMMDSRRVGLFFLLGKPGAPLWCPEAVIEGLDCFNMIDSAEEAKMMMRLGFLFLRERKCFIFSQALNNGGWGGKLAQYCAIQPPPFLPFQCNTEATHTKIILRWPLIVFYGGGEQKRNPFEDEPHTHSHTSQVLWQFNGHGFLGCPLGHFFLLSFLYPPCMKMCGWVCVILCNISWEREK